MKERELEERLENERKGPGIRRSISSTKNSQLKLLAGAVKRKTDKNATINKKLKADTDTEDNQVKKVTTPDSKPNGKSVGLLGLADYGSDSDSEQSE